MRAALLLLLASCTQHADGKCLWVPGDDGTCADRGGSDTDYDPPPRHVTYNDAALAPGHAIVLETGNAERQLLHAPLDPRGLPTQELDAIAGDNPGSIALWPGPDGTALLTMTTASVLVAVMVDAAGALSLPTIVTQATPEQLDVVFDGEAYLAAWSEFSEGSRRHQLKRLWADGRVEATRPAARFGNDDVRGELALATDGAGGATMVYGVRVGGPYEPRELRAVPIVDGEVIEAARVIATDGETCLGDNLALVTARDGYRILTTRRPCESYTPAALVELRLDGTEQPSPLGLVAVPTRWIARRCAELSTTMRSCTDGFLAHDGTQGWFVDGLLTTATPSPWVAGASLRAATSTGTGYVAAFSHDDQLELVRIDPVHDDRVTIAEGYYVPAEDSGCSAGGGASLVPALATLLLLHRRRRRCASIA